MANIDVCDEPEVKMVHGMIENQQMILSVCRPQAPPHDLHEQHFRLGWARQNDASHVPIDARRQCPDVHNDLESAVMKASLDLSPPCIASERVLIGSLDATSLELLLKLLGMRPINSEAERGTSPSMLQPCLYDVSYQLRTRHAFR